VARVSTDDQLGRRDLLVVCWGYIPELIGLLPPSAQWEFHRFYGMSHTLTEEEALARMRAATQREPSLPQKVGKHYKLIFTTFKKHSDVVGKTEWEDIRRRVIADYKAANADPTQKKPVTIMALVKPDLDLRALALASRAGRARSSGLTSEPP
jgi:hypothetical protein